MQAFWKRWEPDSYPESGRRVVIQRNGCLFLGYYERFGKWGMGSSYVTPRLGDLWMYEEEVIKNILRRHDMDTLEEHNSKVRERRFRQKKAGRFPAGVACGKCGAEMVYDAPDMMLASDPPLKTVRCVECGYTGYKVMA